MKKVFKLLFVFVLLFGFTACGKSNTKEKSKVKVYLFEAGGCPYCEEEISYLNSLEGLGTKFEVVRKELYIDHIKWEAGKDFELGVKVSNAFSEKGFENATYQATPFVVISDIYAFSGYNPDLKSIIDKAYEEGDKDIVECLSKENSCDIREQISETDKKINNLKSTYNTHLIVIYVLFGAVVAYLVYDKISKNKEIKNENVVKKATKKKNK